jgi:histidine triad (HIT) family protein
MSEDCIFCSIVAGDIPGRIVHETDHAIAFLDANPLAPGHTLVVPKQHHARIEEIPEDDAADLFGAVHDLVPRVEAAVDAEAVSVGINDGEAAGQEVPHSHVHLVPRFEGDGGSPFHAIAPASEEPADEKLDEIAATIRDD